MPFCQMCNFWFNCFCLRCRWHNNYDNSYPKRYGLTDEELKPLCKKCLCKQSYHHGHQRQFDFNGKPYIRVCYGIACTCDKWWRD